MVRALTGTTVVQSYSDALKLQAVVCVRVFEVRFNTRGNDALCSRVQKAVGSHAQQMTRLQPDKRWSDGAAVFRHGCACARAVMQDTFF